MDKAGLFLETHIFPLLFIALITNPVFKKLLLLTVKQRTAKEHLTLTSTVPIFTTIKPRRVKLHFKLNFKDPVLFFQIPFKALIYDEKFQEALANLESCQKFDPSWDLPKLKLKSTVQLLRGLSQMVNQKGKFKPRKLNILLNVLLQTIGLADQALVFILFLYNRNIQICSGH